MDISARLIRIFKDCNTSRNDNESQEEIVTQEPNEQTPEENLDRAYQRIRK